ncbi:hypothetical protein PPSIR1_14105 [Plesiocystis pacifica SIR-1]|uniref:Lipoprotein n=1 Tax=Plesiocystis pacifica SIR-1 TaxID=391625 RepID=A6G906_9BACT|nr:hypothetical protein [Plesiocystis pacifica]EDM77692.1 hypothetical protein PPSIR1_14105 [Plesiocystis pacifica SIR-1]
MSKPYLTLAAPALSALLSLACSPEPASDDGVDDSMGGADDIGSSDCPASFTVIGMDEPCEGMTPAELLETFEGEHALELFWYAHDGSTLTSAPQGDTTEPITVTVAHTDGELRCISTCGGNEGPVMPGHLELDIEVSWVSESGTLDETFAVTFSQNTDGVEALANGSYRRDIQPQFLNGSYDVALSSEEHSGLYLRFDGEFGGLLGTGGTIQAHADNGLYTEQLDLLAAVYEPD